MALEKILLAVGFRELEDYIESQLSSEFLFVGRTVYREGIVKAINEKAPDIVVIRETLVGNENIMSIVYEIRTTFPKIRIIFVAGNREVGDELLATLVNYGVYDILNGEKIPAKRIVGLIRKPNSYNDIKHFQPVPTLDEARNKMLFEAPEGKDGRVEIIEIIRDKDGNPIGDDDEDIYVDNGDELLDEGKGIKGRIPIPTTVKIPIPIPVLEKREKQEKEVVTRTIQATNEKIITFIGGKSGVGTTSIAINAAFELAKRGNKVIYIEYNTETPAVSYWYELGLVSDGIETALEGLKDRRYEKVENAIIKSISLKKKDSEMKRNYKKFPDTLDFLFFSKEYLSKIKSNVDNSNSKELYLHLLFQMGYDYVIVDVPSNIYNQNTVDAMMYSSKIFTVITQDVSSVGYQLFKLATLERDGIKIENKNNYIVNKYVDAKFKEKDIKEWVQSKDVLIFPLFQEDFIAANFTGLPVILDSKNQSLKNSVSRIADKILEK